MIVEMEKNVTAEQIQKITKKIQAIGFDFQINEGKERIVIAVLGIDVKRSLDPQQFRALDGVEDVIPISKPYKLASRDFKSEDTVIKVGGVEIGGKGVILMAGPCSVEGERQIFRCAEAVKKAGGKILRGGAFKPRTSPYSFRGLKEEGLQFLRRAADQFDLLVVTEVMSVGSIKLVAEYADILQIGARNMQNYDLLEAVNSCKKPVLLKRGPSAEIEEWFCAADYILNGSNGSNVILCERGMKTFERATRYTLDISAVPVAKRLSHLPIIVDPSHAAGNFHYVPALAKAAVAAGADGIIMEIHPEPERAFSDGAQSLTFSDFARLSKELKVIASAIGRGM